MKKTSKPPKNLNRWQKALVAAALAVGFALLLTVGVIRHIYGENLKAVSSSQSTQLVTVPLGASVKEIALMLEEKDLIRSSWAFEWYVRSNGLREKLQAGTYSLTPSQGVKDIANIMTEGRIASDWITILPAQRLDQIKSAFINKGFAVTEVERAFNPELYEDHPALVDKPRDASLEGYLYPETFQKIAETAPETIIRQSLDEMHNYLTPDLRAAIVRQGLTVHDGVILASIIEKEVSSKNPEDKPRVAQVLLKRLRENIALQSDPTAIYGAITDGVDLPGDPARAASKAIAYDSIYNTYKHPGLPPGPISNVSKQSLEALASPASTDYLYFVSGDNGVTYFSKTLEEHQSLTEQHCKKLCGN